MTGQVPTSFDAQAKEQQLRRDADSWDVSNPLSAVPADLPIVDIAGWKPGIGQRPTELVQQVRTACEDIGFFQLTGHGLDQDLVNAAMSMNRRFHALPAATKAEITMDQPGAIGGIGYLPVGHNKLPKRARGNRNAAFIAKTSSELTVAANLWPAQAALPEFRATVIEYLGAITDLALRLVTLYEAALDLEIGFFADAFTDPLARLRLSHYPPGQIDDAAPDQFGIAPHVDTTFFTLLVQDGPGLVVFDAARKQWIRVPVVTNALVVNSGELLRQWSNDRFLSARHFANNLDATDRYSIPFFFNANPDYPMRCLPTCTGPNNPPKYPTITYRESQGVVQGE